MIYQLIPLAFVIGCIVTAIIYNSFKKDPEIIVIDPDSLAVRYARHMAAVSGRIYVITNTGIKREDHTDCDDIVLAIIRPCKLEDFKLEKSHV